jgi:hypothetical protein
MNVYIFGRDIMFCNPALVLWRCSMEFDTARRRNPQPIYNHGAEKNKYEKADIDLIRA